MHTYRKGDLGRESLPIGQKISWTTKSGAVDYSFSLFMHHLFALLLVGCRIQTWHLLLSSAWIFTFCQEPSLDDPLWSEENTHFYAIRPVESTNWLITVLSLVTLWNCTQNRLHRSENSLNFLHFGRKILLAIDHLHEKPSQSDSNFTK